MEKARSKFLNFIKIKRRSWKNLEASKDYSFFLAYPIEASENSVKRWISELKGLRIKVSETISVDGIDEPIIILNKN